MPGYIVRMPDGSTQQVPDEQAANSPLINPNQLKQWTSGVTLPAQQVQSGAIGIQQQQAQLPGQQAQSNVEVATQEPRITQITADSVAAKNAADVIAAKKNIADHFNDKKVQGKDGYVSPQQYNTAKQSVSNLIPSDQFDLSFGQYMNPNNVWYNSADTNLVRSKLPEVGALLKSYATLKKSGAEYGALAKLPIIGNYVQQKQQGLEKAHNDAVAGLTAELLKIAGAGSGSSVRGSIGELNRVAGLIPDAYDTKSVANAKMDQLDTFLQKTYGTSIDNWIQ